MRRIPILIVVGVCALGAALAAQVNEKPWTEWSKRDAEKILNDSPWGQTQIDTDTSEWGRTHSSRPRAATCASSPSCRRSSAST